MPRVVVILLALLIVAGGVLPGETDARRGRKGKPSRTVVVYDFTSSIWDGVIEQTIADFNAVLPYHTRLIHQRGDGSCFNDFRYRYTYVACSVPSLSNASGRYNTFTRRIDLSDDVATRNPQDRKRIVCHELMHALTGVPDHNTFDPVTQQTIWAHPTESCVWGTLSHPGPLDVDTLAVAFTTPRSKRR